MKLNKPMKYILSAVAVTAGALIGLSVRHYFQFSKQVKELFAHSKNISDKRFSYSQLSGLPEPVQRYFRHVLKEGQRYISYVRLKHDGQFKSGVDKDWTQIEGEQYFTTEQPGFIWQGRTSMFTARDMYIASKGQLIVHLFSLLKVVDKKGAQYNQGELLRWLSESVWFPTNLLPSLNLKWSAVDSVSARLDFHFSGLSLPYLVTFNILGEIIQLETRRYMDEAHLETWIIRLADYKMINEVFIPTKAEALWELKTGELSYAKFNVTSIDYDLPKRYSGTSGRDLRG